LISLSASPWRAACPRPGAPSAMGLVSVRTSLAKQGPAGEWEFVHDPLVSTKAVSQAIARHTADTVSKERGKRVDFTVECGPNPGVAQGQEADLHHRFRGTNAQEGPSPRHLRRRGRLPLGHPVGRAALRSKTRTPSHGARENTRERGSPWLNTSTDSWLRCRRRTWPSTRRSRASSERVCREHGAIEVRECVGDDVTKGKLTSFPARAPPQKR
jgi:hypothetical protein